MLSLYQWSDFMFDHMRYCCWFNIINEFFTAGLSTPSIMLLINVCFGFFRTPGPRPELATLARSVPSIDIRHCDPNTIAVAAPEAFTIMAVHRKRQTAYVTRCVRQPISLQFISITSISTVLPVRKWAYFQDPFRSMRE